MIQKVILAALVLIAAQAIHLNQAHEADLEPGTVTIKADNGDNLRVCHSCGGAKTDSASIQYAINDGTQNWTVEVVGSQVAFKGSNGNYLARCNNCWSGAPIQDSVFVHASSPESFSLWTPEQLSDGKYAFKSDNGNYLARCQDCTNNKGNVINFAFVHITTSASEYAQWTVDYV